MFERKQQNSVEQLSFNLKKKKKKNAGGGWRERQRDRKATAMRSMISTRKSSLHSLQLEKAHTATKTRHSQKIK